MFFKKPPPPLNILDGGGSHPWDNRGAVKPQGIREFIIQGARPVTLSARQDEVLRRFTECQKCRISAAPANGSEQRLVVPR